MPILPPTRFEHFGVNAIDIEKLEAFYVSFFGFLPSDRGVRFNGQKIVFLTKSGEDHHQFVLIEGRPADAIYNPINQISFGVQSLDDLRLCFRRLSESGIEDMLQIDHGNAWSLYLKDPEGNPLELFVDSPWYTPQPCRGELDLMQTNEEILAKTEALCRSLPGFATQEQWREGMRSRLASAAQADAHHV
ncbi:glyoxalase/bleomycin resistance protein/dioxygenase superfamily protein [Pseudomonas sp. SJZ103]|uniref:VOC family protein n=1 Tax=unclassified Pseudomonas TaxID=196821 RepID=UPI00119D16EA|nr:MULTISPECIES: VOC family protein [unclassified Pseudomonas]MBB6290564.1 catechol-2,3-dioxygenase [Pseudomonas sp. SJZ073]MBB6315709.1 catechol-2,3-dioxygenase [Pseudomonas sp. JAI120]TWC59712.1 glyoxalase/bleomycin resistance protein/dioxygenase superfamily protein [Pseudomonas sp. SJZ103]TWC77183.1 glyoxalase/bleomycin resistance protein/dioxygenase superfamily protein [Pseudomonas sp. SJZ094]